MHDAGSLVQSASELLGTTRLPSRSVAFAAVLALTEALRACGELLDVVWHNRLQPGEWQVGANADLLHLGQRLQSLLMPYGRRPVVAVSADRAPASALETSWRAGALAARSAADLLRTHREADGSWRSPESAALDDTREVLSAVGAVAHQVRMLAGCAGELARQTLALGVGNAMVSRHLGDPEELREVAARCSQVMPPLDGPVARLGLARPSVRADRSVGQVAGRLARLRRAAWSLSRQAHVPAGTLADFAELALALQEWSVASGSASTPAFRAWQVLGRDLRDLRTASPALSAIRGDVALVRWVLARPEASASCGSALQEAVRTLPAQARWNAQSLARAATADELYIRAAALPGEEVSDRPELVRAKLADRIVPVPYYRLVEIAATYARAASAGS